MIKDEQFTVSVHQFQQMSDAAVEMFCIRLLPGMAFRFATFDKDDYKNGNVTCYLYNHVPCSVLLCIASPLEIEPALELLVKLNPGVEWYWARLNYIDYDKSGHACVTIELHLMNIPMGVTSCGGLVNKL